MARQIKVYGLRVGGQCRQIVAATTKAEAMAALDARPSDFANFGGVTGNEREIAVAMTKPGTVFTAPIDGCDLYVEGKIRWTRGSPWPPKHLTPVP